MIVAAAVEYFPGTSEPVPKLLTALEACRFLRLDLGRETEAAMAKALDRLVERKRIRPAIHLGKRYYDRDELIRYVDALTLEYADVE